MKALVNRIAAHHFRFNIRSMQGEIDVVLPPENPAGPSPKELLLAALCACTGTDVVDLLAKFGVSYDSLSLEARASLTEHHPKIFAEISLTYFVEGPQVDSEKVAEAAKRSMHQYSGTAAMLAKNCPLRYRVVVDQTEIATGVAEFPRA